MPCYNTATRKHLQRVLCRQCSYTDHAAKQCTGLYSGFSCDCTRSTAHDTRPTQAAIIPPAPRWSVSQRRNASNRYQIPTPRRTLYRSSQPHIIIRYIRAQHIASYASPAGSVPTGGGSLASATPGAPAEWSASPPVQGQSGTLYPAGQSSSRGAAGGAELLAACAAALFGLSPDS